MVKKILLIDVEFDKSASGRQRSVKWDNQLQSKWSHHPLGLMSLISSARKKYLDIEFKILHTITCENVGENIKK